MQKPSISFHTVSGITKFHYVLYLIGSVTEVEPDQERDTWPRPEMTKALKGLNVYQIRFKLYLDGN